VCGGSAGGELKTIPSSSFYSQLEHQFPHLRRLYLSDVIMRVPVPDTIDLLSVRNSTLYVTCWPAPRLDAGGRQVLSCLRVVELRNVDLEISSLAALPDSVEKLTLTDTRQMYNRLADFSSLGRRQHMPAQVHFRHFSQISLCCVFLQLVHVINL